MLQRSTITTTTIVSSDHQGGGALPLVGLTSLVSRFEHGDTLQPCVPRHCVFVLLTGFRLPWLPGPFHCRSSSTRTPWEGSLGISSTWQIPTSEFFSPNSCSLYQEEGKSQNGKIASAEAQKEDLAGYVGRTEGRPVQLQLGEQGKTWYRKQERTVYISEGLTGHNKGFGCCYFRIFCHCHGESIIHK